MAPAWSPSRRAAGSDTSIPDMRHSSSRYARRSPLHAAASGSVSAGAPAGAGSSRRGRHRGERLGGDDGERADVAGLGAVLLHLEVALRELDPVARPQGAAQDLDRALRALDPPCGLRGRGGGGEREGERYGEGGADSSSEGT